MSRIDAVLFDFGGVFTGSPFTAVYDFATTLGGDPVAVLQQVFGDYGQDGDHAWHRLERGEISLEAARDTILQASQASLGLAVDLYELLGAMANAPLGGVREPMLAYAHALKQDGVPTAMITNNVREFRDAWRSMLPVDELFDVVIDSSEVGLRKPDPAIYRQALDALGMAAERTVFLDDLEANVQAARDVGMHGIRVDEDYLPALQALDTLRGR